MKKLSKDEMKMVMGGLEEPIDDAAECTTSADCTKFGANCFCLTKIGKCGCPG